MSQRRLLSRAVDRLAAVVITSGGIVMILGLGLIFVLIVAESLPLFGTGKATVKGRAKVTGSPLLAAENEYREAGYAVLPDGSVRVVDLATGAVRQEVRPAELTGVTLAGASRALAGDDFLSVSDGRVLVASPDWQTTYEGEKRTVSLSYNVRKTLKAQRPAALVSGGCRDAGCAAALSPEPAALLVAFLPEGLEAGSVDLSAALSGERVRSLAMSPKADLLAVGTAAGKVLFFKLDSLDAPEKAETVALGKLPITAVTWLLGGQSLLAGDAGGELFGLSPVRMTAGSEARTYFPVHRFERQGAAIRSIAPSPRGRTFVTLDDTGTAVARFYTNERTLASVSLGAGAAGVAFSPKGDGFLAFGDGSLVAAELVSPHPEFSWKALFGKLWYEGSDAPTSVWQSTGGTDDFEAKLSLVPLLFGSMKTTLYATFFAVPLAIAAAFYTAVFARPGFRAIVKPVVEVMAALPSVVIGFIAALWLSPLVERNLLSTFLFVPLIPILVVAGVFAFQAAPAGFRRRVPAGFELVLIVPLTLGAVWLAFALGPGLEASFFKGDFRQWLADSLHVAYDARNCYVVGFAMGFAVIPIIFTISEDALSSVPEHLKAASLALGASMWQTAVRVILPTASAGIFSAVMIGLGRAVGETMIVLMATGNTPVMDMSLFSGARTLSANIAVEIPEAPHGGTHYRILFLSALLLFVITFVANTFAEVQRQRLRKRYSVV